MTQAPLDKLYVLALTRRPDSASFELRFENFIEPLAKRGVIVTIEEIPKDKEAIERLKSKSGAFQLVWWHRYLPSWFSAGSWARALPPVVFDFDDPVCFSSRSDQLRHSFSRQMKFNRWVKHCRATFVGSGYLGELARPCCDDVTIIPMAIDMDDDAPDQTKDYTRNELLWLGSGSTLRYLDQIAEQLAELGEKRPNLTLRLVTHEPRSFGNLNVDFRRWSFDQQDQALEECTIGLCPMPNTPWTLGKCPYKVLQYMAAGMAWVGSPVGENIHIAGSDKHPRGLLAQNPEQWVEKIEMLLDDTEQVAALGRNSARWISLNRTRDNIADLLADHLRRCANTA